MRNKLEIVRRDELKTYTKEFLVGTIIRMENMFVHESIGFVGLIFMVIMIYLVCGLYFK